jgi:hypothetical protein
MKRTTGKEFIKEILDIVSPQQDQPKLLNLIDMLTAMGSQQPYSLGAKPSVNTQWPPPAPETPQNIGASIQQPTEQPLSKKYKFVGL